MNGHHPKLEMAGREQVGWRTAEGRAERLRVRCRLERDWAVVTVEGASRAHQKGFPGGWEVTFSHTCHSLSMVFPSAVILSNGIELGVVWLMWIQRFRTGTCH